MLNTSGDALFSSWHGRQVLLASGRFPFLAMAVSLSTRESGPMVPLRDGDELVLKLRSPRLVPGGRWSSGCRWARFPRRLARISKSVEVAVAFSRPHNDAIGPRLRDTTEEFKRDPSLDTKPNSWTLLDSGNEAIDEEVTQMFLKERQMNADFVSRVSDLLWRGDVLKFSNVDASIVQENLQQPDEMVEDESIGGFLKLTKTLKWVSGDSIAPVNKKLLAKNWRNDSEKRKKLNLLKYEAIKRELLLLTIGIGAGCSVYCLVALSVQAALSYAAGVFFSCLYLQLLYYHIDNVSCEAIPKIFMKKKLKKIGIRSKDLKNTFERTLYGSTMALSSPRLVIPAAIYGIWIISQHTLHDFGFQLVPSMLGFFAYKAAALVQVYRDNKDLLLVFPDSEENGSSS